MGKPEHPLYFVHLIYDVENRAGERVFVGKHITYLRLDSSTTANLIK